MLVDKEKLNQAILMHSQWKKRLKMAVETGKSEFTINNAKNPHACTLGEWLNTREGRSITCYPELTEVHQAFHREAAEILQLALRGAKSEALARLELGSPFGQLTAKLVNYLVELRERHFKDS